jgi:hypothetical protein
MKPREVTPDVLDQLVSGTLSAEAYREVIQALDAQPTLWRTCALAFLEEQALKHELRAIAREDHIWDAAAVAAPGKRGVSPQRTLDHPRQAAPCSGSEHRDGVIRRIAPLVSRAALMLLSFGLGWSGASLRGERPGEAAERPADALPLATRGQPVAEEPMRERKSPAAADWDDAAAPWLMAEDVPSHDWDPGGRALSWIPLDRQVPQALRELERAGRVRIESADALIPVQYQDGTSVIVPVQQFHVVPITYTY